MARNLWLVIAALAGLAGCSSSRSATNAVAPEARATVVHTAPATVEEWPSLYEATGTVRARTTAAISAKMMGLVREVTVQAGDRVKEGQTLVRLDARDLEAAVLRAEAAREEVRSAMAEADSGMAAAKAGVDLAQATFNRMQELYGKKSISSQEFDEASARLKSAQAGYEMARAKRSQLDAKLSQVEQEVRAAQVTRSYAGITAPFAGVVITKSVEPGNMAVPGAPLLAIEREGAFRLEVAVEESRLASIHTGQPVSVRIDAIDRTVAARVSEIVPAIEAASRTGTVKIDLPALPALRSGAFGSSTFSLGNRRVIAIPAASVTERGQLQSVFVADDGTARTRLVTLGQKIKERVEVLSGLNEGEMVIFPIPRELTDSAHVEVQP